MITRRGFLKGLLSSVAAAALVKNGVVQAEQVIAEPERWTIDMAENTWRRKRTIMSWDRPVGHTAIWDRELSAKEILTLTEPPMHVNCRCVIVPYLHKWPSLNWNERLQRVDDRVVQFDSMELYIPKHVNDSVIALAFADIKAARPLPLFLGAPITTKEVQARIDELSRGQA